MFTRPLLTLLVLLQPLGILAATSESYGPVAAGKTLGSIAQEIGKDAEYRGLSSESLALALWRGNPDAFAVGCNMNSLKQGVTLALPSKAEVATIPKAEAAVEVARHQREWKAKRGRVDCPAVLAAAAPTPESPAAQQLDATTAVPAPAPEPPGPAEAAVSLQTEAAAAPVQARASPEPATATVPSQAPAAPPSSGPATGPSPLPLPPPQSEASNIEMGLEFPDLAWLELSADVMGRWRVAPHPENGQWLQIRPQWREPRYRVVAIISKNSSSYSLALEKILEVFGQKGLPAELVVANIDNQERLVNGIIAYAERGGIDLILSIGSESADYLSASYHHGRIPVVTSINKDPVLLGQVANYAGGRDGNIAYTSLNVPLPIYLSYLKTLRPELKAVGLMYDSKHKQVMVTEVAPTKKALAAEGIQVVDVAVNGAKGAEEELATRIPKAVEELRAIDPTLEQVLFWMTSSTAVFSHIRTVNAHTGNIPVVAAIPNAVVAGDDSAVVGIGIDRRSNAHQAALYAIEILTKGTPPGQFEVGIVTPPDIAVNFRVARRIGLKIPFRFFENASFVYDYSGRVVRDFGVKVSH